MADPNYESKGNGYQTPEEIYKPILDFIGVHTFDYDVCCSEFNIPSDRYLTKNKLYEVYDEEREYFIDGGLNENWSGDCWLNPPWNKTKIWLKKAFNEVEENEYCEAWCCIPGDRMNNKYFQKMLNENKNWFGVFLSGKFNFYNPEASKEVNNKNKTNGGLNTPVLILYIGNKSKEYEKRWREEMPIPGIVFN